MKTHLSPLLNPDPAAIAPSRVVDSSSVRASFKLRRAHPISPLDLGVQCYWRASDAVASPFSVAHSVDAGNDVTNQTLWIRYNVAAPVRGALDPAGGHSAWVIRDDSTSNIHGLNLSGWNVNAATGVPIEYEVTIRPVGGVHHLHIYDAWDANPLVTLSPVGGVVTVRTGTNVLARCESLAHGYCKVTIVAPAGVLRCEPSNGMAVTLGDGTSFTTFDGDGLHGFDLFSAYGYQYSTATSVTSIGQRNIALEDVVVDGVNIPWFVPESAAAGQPAFWAAPPQYGILASTQSDLLGYYASGQPHTTAMLIYPERSHTTGVPFFSCGTAGTTAGFAFGTTGTTDQYWIGRLNTAGEWTITSEAMNLNEPSALVVVYTGTHASFYVNGSAVINNMPVTFGTYTPNSVRVYPQNGMAITEVAVFNRALSSAEAASLSEYLLRHFERPQNQLDVHNSLLWCTDPELRLPYAELHLRNDGEAKSIKLRVQNQIHSSAAALKEWGPAVFADGVLIGTALFKDAWSYEHVFQIPEGTRDIVVRDTISEMFKACCVDRVTGDGMRILPEPIPFRRMLVLGDSVACAAYSTRYTSEGWALLLRDTLTNSARAANQNTLLTNWSTGSWALAHIGLTSGQRAVTAPRLANLLNGTDGTDIVLMALGVNDGTGNYASWSNNAANFWTAYADMLQRIRNIKGNRVLAIAPHNCPDSPYAANITAIRNQIVANAEALGTWCRVVNLGAVSVEIDPTDSTGLHPTTAGHLAIYTAISTRLLELGWME